MTKHQWVMIVILGFAVICVYCTGIALIAQNLNRPTQIAKPPEPTHADTTNTSPLPRLVPTNTLTPTQKASLTLTPLPPTAIPTQTSTRTPTTTATKVSSPSSTPTPRPPTSTLGRLPAQVLRVVDGDTIEVLMGGKSYTVRYIGIDTPETVAPNTPVQWMGKEATAANKSLVEGKTISLEKDVSEIDKYGRLLRYVYVGNLFVNAELVRRGYAKVGTYPPDVKYQSLFLQMQQEARLAARGLWSITPTPASQFIAPPQLGNCHPAYPDVCIPPSPPDLDCKDIPHRRFRVLPPDPHRFDGDNDGIGCVS